MQPVVGRAHQTVVGTTTARRLAPCFGGDREFRGNRFVYLLFSPRAGGLTVGINLNPDRQCNFDCIYCEVNRSKPWSVPAFSVEAMAAELEQVLDQVYSGQLRELVPSLRGLPPELLQLRHVALSGEGEPTLCPRFAEAVQVVVHTRARGQFPFFKIVVLTNGSMLDQPQVQSGLRYLIHQDEIWLKLDSGTEEGFGLINRPHHVTYERILENIVTLGRHRPVVIQSLFPLNNGQEPTDEEIDAYAARLVSLRDAGAQIALVQIYSATRPTARSGCRHLPLKTLSRIAQKVRAITHLDVQVF